jgi:GT2 family glycosyltransferase
MDKTSLPPITVVVSTRNREERILPTIQSILSNDYPQFELILVDQSQNGAAEDVLRPFQTHSHFRYIRTDLRGLSYGRNLGIRKTKNEFIAFTDDDCEVPRDWLRRLVASFEVDSHIGIVFGDVVPGPHDRTSGFIPATICPRPFLFKSIYQKHQVEGISACMGIRRSAWEEIGPFDEMLGAGAAFQAGEETDFVIRVLLAGHFVFETPEVKVLHHGFRTWNQGLSLIDHYWYGTGAVFAKHIKCGHWSVFFLLIPMAWRWAFGRSRVAWSLGSHPHRLRRLIAFIQGFFVGMINPVDRRQCQYVQKRRNDQRNI